MNESYGNTNFWNYLELPTPVILSLKLQGSNSDKVVAELKVLMNGIKKTIDDLKQLNIESAVLSRLIYRAKHKLRQEKSFKALQKINRCLTNYQTMHLPFVFSSIRDTSYDDVGPTRQMLEWALVRVLGTAHLFNRLYHLCVDAAGHLYVKIKLGHLLELTFFAIAIVSRIWTLAQFLVRKACDWYCKLHQFLDMLEPSPVPWLPEGCILPLDIVKTLDRPYYLKLKRVPKPRELLSQFNISLPAKTLSPVYKSGITDIDDFGELIPRDIPKEDCDIIENNIQIVSSLHEMNQSSGENKQNRSISTGEYKHSVEGIQSYNDLVKFENKQNRTISTGEYKHSVEGIQSYNDLVKFFKIECTSRNMPSKPVTKHQCLLMNLDKLQWMIVKKFLKKQILTLKKAENGESNANQEKLLKNVRENIIKWIS